MKEKRFTEEQIVRVLSERQIGSDFDAFLEEEGMLADAEAIAAKRVFVFQLEQELQRRRMNRTE